MLVSALRGAEQLAQGLGRLQRRALGDVHGHALLDESRGREVDEVQQLVVVDVLGAAEEQLAPFEVQNH